MKRFGKKITALFLAALLSVGCLAGIASAGLLTPGLSGHSVPWVEYSGDRADLTAYATLQPYSGQWYYPSYQGYTASLIAPEQWVYEYYPDDVMNYWSLCFMPAGEGKTGYYEYDYERTYTYVTALIDFDGNGIYELLNVYGNVFSLNWELYGFNGKNPCIMAQDSIEPNEHSEITFSVWEYTSGEKELVVSSDYAQMGRYENTTAHFVIDGDEAVPYYDGYSGYDGNSSETSYFERANGVTVETFAEFEKIMDEVHGDGKMVDSLVTAGLYSHSFITDDDPEERVAFDTFSVSAMATKYTAAAIMKLKGYRGYQGAQLALPYFDNAAEMKLTPEMAGAYADAIADARVASEKYFKELTSEYTFSDESQPFTVASLFDVGDGVPALWIVYGIDLGYDDGRIRNMYGFMPHDTLIYVWDGEKAVPVLSGGLKADHVFLTDGGLYFYDLISDGGTYDDGPIWVQRDVFYPFRNGTIDFNSPVEYEFFSFFSEDYSGHAPSVSDFKKSIAGTKYESYDLTNLTSDLWTMEYVYTSETYYVPAQDGVILDYDPRASMPQYLGYGSYRATDVSYYYVGTWGDGYGVEHVLDEFSSVALPPEYSYKDVLHTEGEDKAAASAIESTFGGDALALYKISDRVYYLIREVDWALSGQLAAFDTDAASGEKTVIPIASNYGFSMEAELTALATAYEKSNPVAAPEPAEEPGDKPGEEPAPTEEPSKGDDDKDKGEKGGKSRDRDDEPVFEMDHQFPWIIVIIAVAALALIGGGIALLIVLLSRKNKQSPAAPASPVASQQQVRPQSSEAPTSFCPSCGAKVKAGAKFCTGCGNKIE